ncbi:MAG TPA: hypothetical protein VMW36_01925 [Patescibacteria group bacterium]|nr:hypothetical protein [Patescibacteria group bacterium]
MTDRAATAIDIAAFDCTLVVTVRKLKAGAISVSSQTRKSSTKSAMTGYESTCQ